MTTHISKELAEWLKDRGCKIEASACYAGGTMWFKTAIGWATHGCEGPGGEPDWTEDSDLFGEIEAFAYSWHDILVTHAKEFWGEKANFDTIIPAHYYRPQSVLCKLIDSKAEEAEAYVREFSVFAKQSL